MFKKLGNTLITIIGLIIILKYTFGFFGWEMNFNLEAVEKVEITTDQLKYFPDENIESILNGFMEEQHQKSWLDNASKRLNVAPQELSDSLSINYSLVEKGQNGTVEISSTLSNNKNVKVVKELKLALKNYIGRVIQHANKPIKQD
ncbi:MAG: hypothetical protein OCD00_15215 [Colwellia sp.]